MKKYKLSQEISIIIILAELIGFILAFKEFGIGCLIYYTQESNIILLIASILYLLASVQLQKSKKPIPHYIGLIKYVAACSVTVTFVVVLTVLAPTRISEGMGAVIWVICGGSNLFHHMLCPILGVISWLIVDEKTTLKFKEVIIASSTTFLYAVVTIILNVLRVMEGPYVFLYVYEQPVYMSVIWFILIVGGGFLFALLLYRISKRLK